MKKFRAGLLGRTKSHDASNAPAAAAEDSPEASITQGIRQFCEAPSSGNEGEEVLHLPAIVESAESSPRAAAAAAHQIRKFLAKDQKSRVQYNAIMLMRILTDNPGPSFTRNMDAKFVASVKELLKNGKDPSVQQMMRETLDAFEADKHHDGGLHGLLSMWRSMKGVHGRIAPQMASARGGAAPAASNPSQQQQQQQYTPRSQPQLYGLPTPLELASRVEEARNTAKILLQLVQSTPPDQVLDNELVKEFADRCQSAQRSMQEYINCTDPVPDDDTLQTLIETNEQLSLALSRHQRAVLSARRALGASSRNTPSPSAPASVSASGSAAPLPDTFAVPLAPSNPYAVPLPPSNPFAVPLPPSNPFAVPPPPIVTSVQNPYTPSPVSPIHESFEAPPGPPPSHQAQTLPPAHPAHNPFADPGDHEPVNHDLDYTEHHPDEPRHYGAPLDSRPAPACVTESYLGRQYVAANGLTMHGGVGGGEEDVSPVETTREVRYRY